MSQHVPKPADRFDSRHLHPSDLRRRGQRNHEGRHPSRHGWRPLFLPSPCARSLGSPSGGPCRRDLGSHQPLLLRPGVCRRCPPRRVQHIGAGRRDGGGVGVTSTTRAPWARNALAWERGPGVGPPPRACGARMTTGSQPDARSAFAAERMPPSMNRREPTARRDIRMTRARSASPCTTGRAGAPGRWAVLIVGLDDQHLHRGDQPEELPHEGGWRHVPPRPARRRC